MARTDGRRADRRGTTRRPARSRSSTTRGRGTAGGSTRSVGSVADTLLDDEIAGDDPVDIDPDGPESDPRVRDAGDASDPEDADPANLTRTDRASHLSVGARIDSGRGAVTSLARRLDQLDVNWALALVMVACVAAVALTLAPSMRNYLSNRTEFEQLTTSNEQLREQISDYQQKVNEQNDPAYIEAQARERLHYVKPGENALVMMYPGDEARKAAQQREEQRARNAWYANLWDAVATPPGDGAATPPAK